MKICFKCDKNLPLSSFYKHPQMKDGHLNKCKECNKKDVRENYRSNVEYYREYERARAGLPHRVAAIRDYQKTEQGKRAAKQARSAWKRRNPIKRMASVIIGNAVRDGKIKKPEKCSSCGRRPRRLHGHHDDYAFPLIVRWLCPGCHSAWHKINGEGKNAR